MSAIHKKEQKHVVIPAIILAAGASSRMNLTEARQVAREEWEDKAAHQAARGLREHEKNFAQPLDSDKQKSALPAPAVSKALLTLNGETFLARALAAALDGGYTPIIVVCRAQTRADIAAECEKFALNHGISFAEIAENCDTMATSAIYCIVAHAAESGQAESLKCGIRLAAQVPHCAGALTMLADQPLVTGKLTAQLRELFLDNNKTFPVPELPSSEICLASHSMGAQRLKILPDTPLVASNKLQNLPDTLSKKNPAAGYSVAPEYRGRRGNPVLLHRCLFPEILQLSGDKGARHLLASAPLCLLTCTDDACLADTDNVEDYRVLLQRVTNRDTILNEKLPDVPELSEKGQPMPPSIKFSAAPLGRIPTELECCQLWDKYTMLAGIRDHCRQVANFALALADKAASRGFSVDKQSLLAACLLHDIAKTYTIQHGGSHSQLGAVWIRQETGNPLIAQAILYHVTWPWLTGELAPENHPLDLPFLVSYADKRVRHAEIVSLDDRFTDLLKRYGKTEQRRQSIRTNYEQAKHLEDLIVGAIGSLADIR